MWEIIKNIYYIMYPLIKNNMHNCREILTHRVIAANKFGSLGQIWRNNNMTDSNDATATMWSLIKVTDFIFEDRKISLNWGNFDSGK